MSDRARARLPAVLIAGGGLGLLGSLFADWRTSPFRNFLFLFGALNRVGGLLQGDRSAWQLYSIADILLAALAVLLVVVAAIDRWQLRAVAVLPTIAGLVFAIRAVVDPPAFLTVSEVFGTNAAAASVPARVVRYFAPQSGPGETIAIVALAIALSGLALAIYRRP